MNSSLYSCKIVHSRLRPRKHSLSLGSFMFCLDLSELSELSVNISFLSRVYSFVDGDYLPGLDGSLPERVRSYVKTLAKEAGCGDCGEIERVLLLSNLRSFGYIFNPISIYFCFDREKHPICALVEVENTFHEKKPYLVLPVAAVGTTEQNAASEPPRAAHDHSKVRFVGRQKKQFYVSPFSELDQFFNFEFVLGDDTLLVKVNTEDEGGLVVAASLLGEKRELSCLNLLVLSLAYPLVTLRTILGIHFHALLLFLKGTPFFYKEQNQELQTGIIGKSNMAIQNFQSRGGSVT